MTDKTQEKAEDGRTVFTGEVGVTRRVTDLPLRAGWLDDEYDHDNPDGSEYSRRNYQDTSYVSGLRGLVPAEYPWRIGQGGRRDFSVGSPSDPMRPGDRPQGS